MHSAISLGSNVDGTQGEASRSLTTCMLVVEKERCRYEEKLCVLSRYLCGLDRSICGWHSELNQKLLLLYNDS